MPGINMMPSGSTLQIPLDACTNFSGEAGNAQVTLTWTDPKDKYATPEGETAQDPDQLVSVWEYTQIIRKTGSQPTGPHDGELVVFSSVRDQYATTGFVDDGLTNNTLYYYAAYAYNTDGVASEGAFASATPIAGTPLSQLAEGTLIKILENGSPVEFYLSKHSYEPSLNGEGRELLVRKDIPLKVLYGQDQWVRESFDQSDVYNWCNQSYYNLFSEKVKQMIGSTKFYTGQSTRSGPTGAINVQQEGHVFILSFAEYGFSDEDHGTDDGNTLPIASTLKIASLNGVPSSHWTRSWWRASEVGSYIWCVSAQGTAFNSEQQMTPLGCRPVFTLPATARVDAELNLMEE